MRPGVLGGGEHAGVLGPRQQVGERVEGRFVAGQPGMEVHQRGVDLLGDLQAEVLAELAGSTRTRYRWHAGALV